MVLSSAMKFVRWIADCLLFFRVCFRLARTFMCIFLHMKLIYKGTGLFSVFENKSLKESLHVLGLSIRWNNVSN